jgi:hypothetical protein
MNGGESSVGKTLWIGKSGTFALDLSDIPWAVGPLDLPFTVLLDRPDTRKQDGFEP